MNFKNNKLALAVFAAAASSTVYAQGPQIEEVLVTAQKREQTLQDVPVAVSAFSGDFMKKANIDDVRGLVDFTPGFSGRTEDSFTDALAMRGIVTNDFGIGGDPSVAVFQDGVWAGRTGGVQMSFFDIARAEVVKGPQGTLFGRNAIAGAVEIVTNKPTDVFEANVDVTVAQYNELETTFTVNQPLTDNLYFRGSFHKKSNDGYLENMQGGDDLGFHENTAARLALRYETDTIDAVLTYHQEERDQDPSVYWDPAAGLPHDKVNIDLKGGEGFDRSDIQQVDLNLTIDINDKMSLTSITAHKSYDFEYLEDYDAGPELVNNYYQGNDVTYMSQELRLNFAGENVSWFVGAAGYREDIEGYFTFDYDEDALCRAVAITDAGDFDPSLGAVTGCDSPGFEDYWGEDIDPNDIMSFKQETSDVDVSSDGWAVFGDLTYSFTESLDLSVGARYTVDNKSITSFIYNSGGALGNNFNYEFFTKNPVSNEDQWTEFTPRIAVNYQLNDEIAVYANAAKGYKAGGFATFGFGFPAGGQIRADGSLPNGSYPLSFDPETVMSYEMGMKTRLLDNAMQFNVAAFMYDYTDLQLSYFASGSTQVTNVGEAAGRGVEMDLRYLPSENWDLFLSASFLDTEITDEQNMPALGACGGCEGNALPFAPEFTAAAIVNYMIPVTGGEFFITGEVIHQSEMFGGPDNIKEVAVQPWTEMGLRFGYESESGWDATLFVDNVTNEQYFERGWENADVNNEYGYGLPNTMVWPNKPRTIGVSFSLAFD